MLHELILISLLSCVPALLSYFLDYCFGRPMSDEPKTREIFSFFPLWLAKRRLSKEEVADIKRMFSGMEPDEQNRIEAKKQFHLGILNMGRERFTWEKAFGMCIICTGFWIAMIFAIFFFFFLQLNFLPSFSLLLLTPIISHLILRKL